VLFAVGIFALLFPAATYQALTTRDQQMRRWWAIAAVVLGSVGFLAMIGYIERERLETVLASLSSVLLV
jgi:hypothetical protein